MKHARCSSPPTGEPGEAQMHHRASDAVQQPAGKRAGRGPKHEETLKQVAVAVVVVAVDVRIVI